MTAHDDEPGLGRRAFLGAAGSALGLTDAAEALDGSADTARTAANHRVEFDELDIRLDYDGMKGNDPAMAVTVEYNDRQDKGEWDPGVTYLAVYGVDDTKKGLRINNASEDWGGYDNAHGFSIASVLNNRLAADSDYIVPAVEFETNEAIYGVFEQDDILQNGPGTYRADNEALMSGQHPLDAVQVYEMHDTD